MGCLIKIKLTEKASEDFPDFFIVKYEYFFKNCKIVQDEMEGKKKVFLIYTIWPENKTSKFLVNTMQHDRKIEKCTIISQQEGGGHDQAI